MNRTLVERFYDVLEKAELRPVSVEIHRGSMTFKWTCAEQAMRFSEAFQTFCSVFVREISGPDGKKAWITLAIADGGKSPVQDLKRGPLIH